MCRAKRDGIRFITLSLYRFITIEQSRKRFVQFATPAISVNDFSPVTFSLP